MKTPYYGMFTDEGNARVLDIVEIAILGRMSWSSVQQMLDDLSTIDGYGEASDTAVRDEVHLALTMADYERRVENI